MTRYTRPPFQLDKPIFCKVPQPLRGRIVAVGEQYKWEENRVPVKKIHRLYVQGAFYHSDELEEKLAPTIGDGLEELNIEALHKVVDKINDKVKSLDDNKIRPCKKSNIKVKQAALIRSWRLYHGEHE